MPGPIRKLSSLPLSRAVDREQWRPGHLIAYHPHPLPYSRLNASQRHAVNGADLFISRLLTGTESRAAIRATVAGWRITPAMQANINAAIQRLRNAGHAPPSN
jgi:hypothetical protein